jgi:hypothetical protein
MGRCPGVVAAGKWPTSSGNAADQQRRDAARVWTERSTDLTMLWHRPSPDTAASPGITCKEWALGWVVTRF